MTGLTLRGKGLLALGAVALGAGWVLGQPAALAVGVLLVLIPLLGLVAVRRSRFLLGASRTIEPAQFAVGDAGEVVLTVENASRLASGALLLEDTVPAALGSPARLVLDRVPPRAQRAQRYPLEGRGRGRFRIGPLRVTATDPFGAATLTREFSATAPVLVTPRIVPLGRQGSALAPGGRGDTVFRSVAARGDDDVLPREHRAGDDMRRIHWRATARVGELMVRREEQSWHSSLVIVLDTRASAHSGSGAASTFEWAVSAAASVGMHYLRLGWRVTLVDAMGAVLAEAQGATTADAEPLLQAVSDVHVGSAGMSPTLGTDLDGASAIVAVLGRVGDDAARALARPASGFAACLPLEPAPEALLRSHGWRVGPWTRSTPVADAWAAVAPQAAGANR